MSEQNEAVVRRIFAELVNGARYDVVDELYLPTFVDHDPLPGAPEGPAAVVYTVQELRRALPDLHVTMNRVGSWDDKVFIHNTWEGTHVGRVLRIPPTGRRVTFSGQVLFRFEEHRVAERWARLDLPLLMRAAFGRQSTAALFTEAQRRLAVKEPEPT